MTDDRWQQGSTHSSKIQLFFIHLPLRFIFNEKSIAKKVSKSLTCQSDFNTDDGSLLEKWLSGE